MVGRNISFNKEKSLNEAMYLFWKKGYDATCISDLIKRMGISRSTLYDSFGDKKQLFKLVLENYMKYNFNKKELLFSSNSVKESLKSYFYKHIRERYSNDTPESCIITNSSILIGHVDSSIEEMLINDFNELEKSFKQVIKKGQCSGEISEKNDCEMIAYALLSLNHSINVMSQFKKDKDLAIKLVNKTIECL
ncbi:TetR/AcrR family transcriptional regulator [Clostridium akagii]|uniref:TetR/AcrR family transcriptional regulator n=1 Tax=Clostridium akagii TaxID=91623 RepID=UPI000A6D3AA9|nr:TetR/AcrR family transcriptional regulator [Clostridium akagii]